MELGGIDFEVRSDRRNDRTCAATNDRTRCCIATSGASAIASFALTFVRECRHDSLGSLSKYFLISGGAVFRTRRVAHEMGSQWPIRKILPNDGLQGAICFDKAV